MREKIVQIEVQLRDEADVVSGARIDGNYRFGSDLEILARPDDARIDGAGNQSALPAVEWIANRNLDQWNQTVEWWAQPDASDLLLQVNDAVLDGKPGLQNNWIS